MNEITKIFSFKNCVKIPIKSLQIKKLSEFVISDSKSKSVYISEKNKSKLAPTLYRNKRSVGSIIIRRSDINLKQINEDNVGRI